MQQTEKELWRGLDGVWKYSIPEREAVAKVKLTDEDRKYLNKYPDRVGRFT